MGGLFTAEMKYAGLDSIILEGISPKPVYLFIDDRKIELRDAAEYWGKGTFAVEKAIKEKFGEEFQIAVIGPGGENGVLVCPHQPRLRAPGGARRRGHRDGRQEAQGDRHPRHAGSVPVADPEGYRKAGMALYKACKDAEGLKEWTTYGTTIVTSWCDEVGALPTRNFSAGSFEDGKTLYGPVMRKEIVITDKGCFGCPCPCGKYSRMKRYGTNVEGPEYETIGLMGSNLGIGDIQDVAQANLLADDLGIDTISAGNAIAWAMECYEKGIFTKKDTGGLDLRFGNVEAAFKMIEMIARREGLGALLGEGREEGGRKRSARAARRFAIHVKGMEQSGYATHNATAMLLAYMTCDVGAHHNRAWAITYDLQVGRDRVVPEKVARVIWLQHFRPMFDVLGACRLQWVELGIDRDLYVPALEAITGIHRSWQELEMVGERVWNLTRMYWIREIEGFGREWDLPSPRFYEDPPKTGATAGQITKYEDVQKLLDMYYEQRGLGLQRHPDAGDAGKVRPERGGGLSMPASPCARWAC